MDNNNRGDHPEGHAENASNVGNIAARIEANRNHARSRMTKAQMDIIAQYLYLHPQLAQEGDLGLNGRLTKDTLWKKLAETVSAMGNTEKTTTQCMNAWVNMKKQALDKLSVINLTQKQSGPPALPPHAELNERDMMILSIWGTTPATGFKNGTLGLAHIPPNLLQSSAPSRPSKRPKSSANPPKPPQLSANPPKPPQSSANPPKPPQSSANLPKPGGGSGCISKSPLLSILRPSISSADSSKPSTVPAVTSTASATQLGPSGSHGNESARSIPSPQASGLPIKRKRQQSYGPDGRFSTLMKLSDVSSESLRAMQNYSDMAERYFPLFAECLQSIRDSLRELVNVFTSINSCSNQNSSNLPPTSDSGLAPATINNSPPISDSGLAPATINNSPPTSESGLAPATINNSPPTSDSGFVSALINNSPCTSDSGLVSATASVSRDELQQVEENNVEEMEIDGNSVERDSHGDINEFEYENFADKEYEDQDYGGEEYVDEQYLEPED